MIDKQQVKPSIVKQTKTQQNITQKNVTKPGVVQKTKVTGQPQLVTGEAPIGVKIIAILNYISAAFGILISILLIIGTGFITNLMIGSVPGMEILARGLLIAAGIVMLLLSVLAVFIGRGLWKLQPWARIVSIVFAALGVLGAIGSLIVSNWINGIVTLLINSAIGGYLLFAQEVKTAFAK